MKLVVGLGNPGKEYENTRHNVGFMIVDNYLKASDWKQKFDGFYCIKNFDYEKVFETYYLYEFIRVFCKKSDGVLQYRY